MGCFDHMIKYLSNKKDYDFDSHEESAEALRRASVGNPTDPTEPFSSENYQSWANNLKHWDGGLK